MVDVVVACDNFVVVAAVTCSFAVDAVVSEGSGVSGKMIVVVFVVVMVVVGGIVVVVVVYPPHVAEDQTEYSVTNDGCSVAVFVVGDAIVVASVELVVGVVVGARAAVVVVA